MSYPILLCVVAVEALNVVVLWTALRARISRVVRPLVACCGLSGAWGAWVLVIVVPGPAWMMALTVSVFAMSSLTMGVAIYLATYEEEGHDGGAGGAPGPCTQAPDGGGDGEPLWWAEFERQLAAYAARHDRVRQRVDC